jgi:hypothetical protein
VKRRVVVEFRGSQSDYEMGLLIVMRRLSGGQMRGEVQCGDGVFRHWVETDHMRTPAKEE